MKKTLLLIFATLLAVCLVIGGLQAAWAQDDEFTLEEITVTAQKREQNVQDVPIAMTITNAEQIDRQKVYTLQDLARTTPGLEFGDTKGAGPGGAAVIRGIGTAVFDMQAEPSVGVVVDGVAQGASNAGNLFDVERVEVLRGPQGTLFGNAASAGVINIVTASPELSVFKAKIGVDMTFDDTFGSKFGRQEIRAMVNVPTTEKTALRLTANANLMQGLLKNTAEGADDQDAKNYGFRAKYLYQPSDDLSVNLIVDYADNKTTGPDLFTLAAISPSDVLYDYFTSHGVYASSQNQDVYHSSFDFLRQSKKYGLSAEIDWVMANHDFVSITSYKKDEIGPETQNIFGYEWTPFLLEIKRWGRSTLLDTFAQEFRVSSPEGSKLNYVAGLYYNQMKREPDVLGSEQLLPPVPPPELGGPPPFLFPILFPVTQSTLKSTVENKNYAAFADASYPVTDTVTVLGGVRYSVYDFSIRNEDVSNGTVIEDGIDKGYVTFRAGVQYDLNPDTMFYATVSSGVKTPIVSPPPITEPDGPSTFIKAERPTNYEMGTKLTAFDNRVALDLNGFYTKVKDYQGQICWTDPETSALACQSASVDEIESKGIEVDIFGQPMAGVKINVGYLFNIAEFPSDYGDLAGEQILNAPRNKLTLNAEYERNVTEGLLGFAGFDTVYKSDKRVNTALDPSSIIPSHWVTGARIGIRDLNDKWNLYLFGRNLFEESEPVAQFSFGDTAVMMIPTERDFRQVGLSFNMNF